MVLSALLAPLLSVPSLAGLSVPSPMSVAAAAASQRTRAVEVCQQREVVTHFEAVQIPAPESGPPRQQITVVDLTPTIRRTLTASGLRDGTVTLISRHTTTGITINEYECRLARDLQEWLLRLAPPDDRSAIGSADAGVRYAHNDIDARPDGDDERQRCLENGWNVDDPHELQRWRDQEPINAHSHLAAMLLGSSESIPVAGGQLVLGQWQSALLVDVDGPRARTVGVHVMGFK